MASFELRPLGPYSLRSSIRFLEGFAPADYEGGPEDELRLAFVADGGEEAAGVVVRSKDETSISCEVFGEAAAGVVKKQVERILSLDVDGRGFPEVGRLDPVVGGLQERYPGLRPVCFNSPYEAAAWAVIGQRVRIKQAAKVKSRMARELGEPVEMRGRTEHAFPAPSCLAALESFPGLNATKVERLRGIGRAAAEGRLDASSLRSMPEEEALSWLKELPGIGDFSAGLILLRGAGAPDGLPTREPRLGRAVALAYGLEELPTAEELRELAKNWRPYRTWVCLLLRTMLEDETGEIGGRAPQSERPSA